MDLEGATGAASALLRGLDARWRTCTDDELLADGAAVEDTGRLVDALRVAFAAEVEARASVKGEGLRLPARYGLRDGTDLVMHIARVSRREAARRVNIGVELASRWSLAGDELPSRYPRLATAAADGLVGLDAARIITGMIRGVRKRADAKDLADAEAALTAAAIEQDAEALRVLVASWRDALDPDGTGEREHQAWRQRAFVLGRLDEHGGSSFFGYLPAEERAQMAAYLAEQRKQTAMTRRPVGHEDNDGPGAEWVESEGERRTSRQVDFDTFWGTWTAGVRASATEATATAASVRAIPEVVVVTTLDDLESRTGSGSGTLTGTSARVSTATVERLACGGDLRLQIDGLDGVPLHLGKPVRYFTPGQKKAIVAASGGGCGWPGCSAPPVWCDVHHIAWYQRDDGPTDVANGILLCSFHHHLIHDPRTRWRIILHRGQPHLVPLRWRGAPEPQHRMRGRHAPPVREHDLWGRPSRT